MSDKTHIDNDSLKEAIEEALTNTQDEVTRAIITAIRANAEEREPSLREVVEAIEENGWDLDDLGIDADDVVREMDPSSIVYAIGLDRTIDGCVENDGASDVLREVIDRVDRDDLFDVMGDYITLQQHVEHHVENGLDDKGKQAILAALKLETSHVTDEEREKIRAEVRAEVEREVQAKLVACLFGKQEGV